MRKADGINADAVKTHGRNEDVRKAGGRNTDAAKTYGRNGRNGDTRKESAIKAKAWRFLRYPASLSIFLFYAVMSIMNGSVSLFAAGTAAAAGAWILEIIFRATSVSAAQSGTDSSAEKPGAEAHGAAGAEPEHGLPGSPASFGRLLSMTSRGKIIVLKRAA
ncbi:MAG: hypothetical protein Q4D81_09700 [Eubacteriales bacterium]|nr:hypothetical protein [Eubacteriales bacterium]